MTTLTDAQSKLDSAGCLTCFTLFQLALIQTRLLFEIANGSVSTVTTLAEAQAKLDAAGCLTCFTGGQLQLIQTQLLMEIDSGGGGGGSGCLLCSDADPVAVPPCDCAIHYNRIDFSLWIWLSGGFGPGWFKILG